MMNVAITYPYAKPEQRPPRWWLLPLQPFWFQRSEDYVIFCAWRRCGALSMPVGAEYTDPDTQMRFHRRDATRWDITSTPPGSIEIRA